jgi:hypothetical protein
VFAGVPVPTTHIQSLNVVHELVSPAVVEHRCWTELSVGHGALPKRWRRRAVVPQLALTWNLFRLLQWDLQLRCMRAASECVERMSAGSVAELSGQQKVMRNWLCEHCFGGEPGYQIR